MLAYMRALVLSIPMLLWATHARAQEDKLGYTGFVSIGPQLSVAFCCDEKATYGVGLEASYSRYRPRQFTHVGGFAVWQIFFPGSRGYHRLAAGGQAGWAAFGSELGLAYQSASPVTSGAVGVQVTPYLTAGLAWTGFRFTFPAATSVSGKGHALRVEWVLAAKLPIRADGDEYESSSSLGGGGGHH